MPNPPTTLREDTARPREAGLPLRRTRPAALAWAPLGLLLLFVAVAAGAQASHFRAGTLTWEPGDQANEVVFRGEGSFRWSFFSAQPAVGDTVVVAPVGSAVFTTGDGTTVTIRLKVEVVNLDNDWIHGRFVDADGNDGVRHVYPAPNNGGVPWVARFDNPNGRTATFSSNNYHVNNGGLQYRLETVIDLAAGTNRAPRVSLAPIVGCVLNETCLFRIAATDPDGDTVGFRLSSSLEASGGSVFRQPGPAKAPNLVAIDASTGWVTWNATGASFNATLNTLYSMQVMVSDARTKTPVDFFIQLVVPPYVAPQWVQPPTPCGETFVVPVEEPVGFDVRAETAQPFENVRLKPLLLPDGATLTSPAPAPSVTATFAWTPGPDQWGTYPMVFSAEDGRGIVAPMCDVTVVTLDVTPPTTIASASGVAGNAPWFRSSVEVTLAATDLTSGVAHTHFRVDAGPGEAWQEGTSFTVAGDGTHLVEFRSEDVAGNVEAGQSLVLRIDTTPPTVALTRPVAGNVYLLDVEDPLEPALPVTVAAGDLTVLVAVADATSGAGRVDYYVDGVLRASTPQPSAFVWEAGKEALGEHVLRVVGYDAAGNAAPNADVRVTTVPTTPEGLGATLTTVRELWTQASSWALGWMAPGWRP